MARLAGVSHQAVSRYMADSSRLKAATSEKVERAMADLKYPPNLTALCSEEQVNVPAPGPDAVGGVRPGCSTGRTPPVWPVTSSTSWPLKERGRNGWRGIQDLEWALAAPHQQCPGPRLGRVLRYGAEGRESHAAYPSQCALALRNNHH
ncbi:LacI family DNA-binding transcriptional regulator [Arthrobacter sp. SLBN-100]|uniref:LacI family DNA-binding transcriptional regulator n=1 Tax=Arthrobacter sp. SLBN-100 TaxID=2768450 RepID=UPI00190FAC33